MFWNCSARHIVTKLWALIGPAYTHERSSQQCLVEIDNWKQLWTFSFALELICETVFYSPFSPSERLSLLLKGEPCYELEHSSFEKYIRINLPHVIFTLVKTLLSDPEVKCGESWEGKVLYILSIWKCVLAFMRSSTNARKWPLKQGSHPIILMLW